MSRAEDLAGALEEEATSMDMGRKPIMCTKRKAAAELRRLSAVEAELIALKKAISEAKPLFWYRPVMGGEMYEGPHHNNSVGGKMMRDEKPGEWVPLYTLKGIK